MTRSLRDAERACEMKRRYPSAGAAANAARVADAVFPAANPRRWYLCDRCGQYHLTTNKPKEPTR